jgi:hypothetical protein
MEVAMADPTKPKGARPEGATRAFRIKMDGWMEEILKKDLDPEAEQEEEEAKKDEQTSPSPAPKPAPSKPA